jgi:membrane associated rhomboid family serine protease
MPYHEDQGPPMFTYAMLAVYIAFFGAELRQADLSRFYAYPWRVADGELWRLITSTLLHGSILHIAFNASLFYRFSTVIDNWLGPWGALGLYVFFALGSSAAQILVSPGIGSIGASGVVYGLFGFLWVMSRRRDDAAEAANAHTVQTMLGWLVVCFVINLLGAPIANTAHLAGLGLGWLTGQTVVARRSWRIPMAIATVAACALPIVLTQRAVWERTLAYVPFLNHHEWHDYPPDVLRQVEDPAHARVPGLF